MSSPDENIDPHSLPNLSILISDSARKDKTKRRVHNGSSSASGLRQSILTNIFTQGGHSSVGYADRQLPSPPSSQSMDPTHDNIVDELRLPISPPPEEEIRVKELSANAHPPKPQNKSRLPVPFRGAPSAPFKFPTAPQSFAQYQQHLHQRSGGQPSSSMLATNAPSTSSNNPRKRARSAIPPFIIPASVAITTFAPSSSNADSTPVLATSVSQSPNPKPRKQPKTHDSGVYAGSGFKRRHTRGTSTESLHADDPAVGALEAPILPSQPLKSPARKKRTKDPGVENYTPQRDRTTKEVGSPVKQKTRPRRSATPDVPYEPPNEQFTPPRHVVLQPPSSTTSTRSRKPRQSSAQPNPSTDRKIVRVKPERLTSPFPPPSIDLLKPTAPPSPTDDPILLIGPAPARRTTRVTKTLVDAAVGEDNVDFEWPGSHQHETSPSTPVRSSSRHAADESAWHMAPGADERTALLDIGFDGPSQFDATFDPAPDSDSYDAAPLGSTALHGHSPRLDPDLSTGSHIFHSDDDEAEEVGEDEGEYTGRFKFYSVPVKQDPPSSATRERRESWGRPISPFPFQRQRGGQQVAESFIDDNRVQELFDGESPPPSPSDGRRRPGTPKQATETMSVSSGSTAQTHRTRGFTLSEMEARLEARNSTRRASARHFEAVVAETEDADRAVHFEPNDDEIERGGLTVHAEDGNAQDEANGDEEEIQSVEREVTPVDETPNIHYAQDGTGLSEIEDEGDHEAEFAAGDGHSQSTPGSNSGTHQDDNTSDQGHNDEEHDAQLPVSPHEISRSPANLPWSPRRYTEHSVALRDQDNGVANIYDGDDGFSDEDVASTGVVEISSDDPKAAARAAAILKLHHSYIVDGVVAQRSHRSSPLSYSRRRSFAFGDGELAIDAEHQDMLRRARRKSIASGGGVLRHRSRQTHHSPLAHSVFAPPASPAGSAMSTEDVLREAETEIRATKASPNALGTPLRSRLFGVASPQRRSFSPPQVLQSIQPSEPPPKIVNQREWAKSDWKILDTCFTDERVAAAKAMGLDALMAEVDDVDIDAVVDRFLIDAEEEWDRDMLLRRATALSARQSAGQGAPPSPRQSDSRHSTTELVVPAFTPSVTRRSFVPPDVSAPTKLPPSLLAPRYAHLHEEAVYSVPPASSCGVRDPDGDASDRQDEGSSLAPQLPAKPSTPQPTRDVARAQGDEDVTSIAPASATKRVLSYLGSFLGRGPLTKSTKPVLQPRFNALPLPPPEMRQTSRGPVTTPAKKPIPRSRAPRDLVQLTETLLPTRSSVPPRAQSARDMVNLNHVDPPRSVQRQRTTSAPIVIPGRTRKDSGGSVKDLIRSFEEVEKKTREEMARSTGSRGSNVMRKVASVGDFKGRAPWKP